MTEAVGASVPDQALLASLPEPASGLVPTGDDPSRGCTCHPDDRPHGPCQRRYAASECQRAARACQARSGLDPSRCANCEGCGWVCENHPDRPWEHMSAPGEGCDCGAGSPCPVCNLRLAAAGLTEPLRLLVERCIGLLESAERETNWGDPLFGPSPSEEIQEALDAYHASAMSTGTANTAQPVEGRSPASATVADGDAQ